MKNPSVRSLRNMAKALRAVNSLSDLAALLETRRHHLQLLAMQPEYHLFSRPKKDGSLRWIEDPAPELKRVQKTLNKYLQACYYFDMSPVAFGFVISPSRNPDPRNILTNAYQHLGASWMLNADMEDFFHTVTAEMVFQIFSGKSLGFHPDLARLLTDLSTHRGRLPMGAPTSPVLSNFACKQLDQDLIALGNWAGCKVTRFADDMSFSSAHEIGPDLVGRVDELVQSHGFQLNSAKQKLYGPTDDKIVTGLRITTEGEVKLPSGFLQEMHQHIDKLNHVMDVAHSQGSTGGWVKNYREKVEGMLNFASFVLGDSHPEVLRGDEAMEEAMKPSDELGSMSWLEFGYV